MTIRRASIAIGGALCLVGMASPGHAINPEPAAKGTAIQTISCTKDGFRGTLKFTSSMLNGAGTIYRIEYKIDKGSESGGNSANIWWYDSGLMPTKVVYSGDDGKQDNQYHTLLETNYFRGSGGNEFKFIFDKSGAGDPQCAKLGPF